MGFLGIMIIIACVIGVFISIMNIIYELVENNHFSVLAMLGIAVCLITIASVFQFSTYTLENNIKSHTYIVKGKIVPASFINCIKIDNKNYNVDLKYSIEPFAYSDFIENDRVEVVVANSIFNSYIIKVNKIEKITK